MTSAGIDWQREKWQSGLGSKFIHQGEKNAVKYADEVIVLSKGVQDYFKETYDRETHFIPNGVNTYFRLHDRNNAELLNSARDYILKNPSLPELNFVFQQIRDCQAEGHTLKIYLESKVMELLSLVVKGMEQEQKHISVKLDYKDIRNLRKTVTVMKNDLAACS